MTDRNKELISIQKPMHEKLMKLTQEWIQGDATTEETAAAYAIVTGFRQLFCAPPPGQALSKLFQQSQDKRKN